MSASAGTGSAAGSTASPAGSVYRNGDHHFSFTPPSDWAAMAPNDLGTIVSLAGIPYLAGFRKDHSISPYLLVQMEPSPSGNPEAHQAELQEKTRESIHDPSATLTWDDRRKAFTLHATVSAFGLPPTPLTSYLFVGKEEIIILHCYPGPEGVAADTPVFEAMADSFRFDPGYDYGSRSLFGISWGHVADGAQDGAIIGAIAGGLGGLMVTLARRKQRG